MTTGNKVIDKRTGTYQIGTYYSRSWSGDNYPATKAKVMSAWTPPVDRYGRPRPSYLRTYFVKSPRRSYLTPHAYSLNLTDYNNAVITAGPYTGRSPQYLWGNYAKGYYYTNPWTANDDLALLTRLREKCAGSTFNAGVFLGEGHQTLRLIGDTAYKLARAFRKVKKGDLASASRILTGKSHDPVTGKVANNWLELQYGWLPLLSDCHDGALFLAHHLNTPLTVKVRARFQKKRGPTDVGYPYPNFSSSLTTGQIIAYLKEKNVAQLSGLTNPASIAWELVPFSFVVDWFLPIGQYLDARGLQSALTGTFVTTKVHYVSANCYNRSSAKSLDYRYKSVDMTRTISTTLSVPTPVLKPLGKVASWQHAANGIALLTQVFNR